MSRTWYLEISPDASISQGDIFLNCPVFIPEIEVNPNAPGKVGKAKLKVRAANIVVLTQACDLENDPLENIVVAPIYDVSKISVKKGTVKDHVTKVHAGRISNQALIGKYDGEKKELHMNYQIVDFSELFILPYDFLMSFRETHGTRLRLNSPHRELLNQQMGNYFSRIGLPNEDVIDRKDLQASIGGN